MSKRFPVTPLACNAVQLMPVSSTGDIHSAGLRSASSSAAQLAATDNDTEECALSQLSTAPSQLSAAPQLGRVSTPTSPTARNVKQTISLTEERFHRQLNGMLHAIPCTPCFACCHGRLCMGNCASALPAGLLLTMMATDSLALAFLNGARRCTAKQDNATSKDRSFHCQQNGT